MFFWPFNRKKKSPPNLKSEKIVHDYTINYYLRCPKLARLDTKAPHQDSERHELAKRASTILHADLIKENELIDKQTLQQYLNHKKSICIVSPRIQLKNVHLSLDLLFFKNGRIQVFQLNLGYFPINSEKTQLLIAATVLKEAHCYIQSLCLLCINKSYKSQISSKQDSGYKPDSGNFFTPIQLTDQLLRKTKRIKAAILAIRKDEDSDVNLDRHCFKPKICSKFNSCWTNSDSWDIFNLYNVPLDQKITLFQSNIRKNSDILSSSLVLSDTQRHQINSDSKNIVYSNNKKLSQFLSQLNDSVSCFDIESAQFIYPHYSDLSPFDYVPFLFSLHQLDANLSIMSHECLLFEPGSDFRRRFALSLITHLSSSTCIVVFDATLEKEILTNLAELFPDLKKDLLRIRENFLDVAPLFTERHIILPGMKGKCSLKSILPCIDSSLDYDQLSVQSGFDAAALYKELFYTKQSNSSIREQLKSYCSLDTLALVKLLQFLKKLHLGSITKHPI